VQLCTVANGPVYRAAAGLRARGSDMVPIADVDCVVTRAANFTPNALITRNYVYNCIANGNVNQRQCLTVTLHLQGLFSIGTRNRIRSKQTMAFSLCRTVACRTSYANLRRGLLRVLW
jgi:hypothetical protein